MDWIRELMPFVFILLIVWKLWQWETLYERVEQIDRRVESLFDDMLVDEDPEESGGK